MNITCNMYFENYLGGICKADCEHCFGDKEIYECMQDVEFPGIINSVKFRCKKGEWFWKTKESEVNVALRNCGNKEFSISKEFFEKYFTDKFYIDI